jgi:hypothetical protein
MNSFERKRDGIYLGSTRNLGSVGSTCAPAAAAARAVVTPSAVGAGLDLSIIKNAIAPANKAIALVISKDLKWLMFGMGTSGLSNRAYPHLFLFGAHVQARSQRKR